MVDLQVEGLRVGALHHRDVVSRPLVGLGQSVGPPVGPVHLPAVHGDGKGVGQVLVAPQHLDQPGTVVHCRVDSVRPADRGGGRSMSASHSVYAGKASACALLRMQQSEISDATPPPSKLHGMQKLY